MYTYKDISNMINDSLPCKNVFYCPFGCSLFLDSDLLELPCINICNILNIADYQLYWGEFK